MGESWLKKISKRKDKPKEPEENLLAGIPPDWAGPLTVICITFALFFVFWFLLAKRPTTERLANKYKLRHAAGDTNRFYDPRSGQSHRIFKSELATRLISSIHAVIMVCGAMRCLHLDQQLSADTLWHTSQVARFYFSISIAYYIGNIIVGIVMFRAFGALFLIHGIASLIALSIFVFGRCFHFFGCVGMFWELSSVFVNIRWFLLEYGVKSKWLMILNNYALATVFGLSRIILGLPLLYQFWSELAAARGEGKLSRAQFFACSTLIAAFTVINMVWFKRVLQKLVKGDSRVSRHPQKAHGPETT